MKIQRRAVILVILAGFIAGCSSRLHVYDVNIPKEWDVEIKKTVANPFQYKFTFLVNGQEVLETLSNSKEPSETEFYGRNVRMTVGFSMGFLHHLWSVSVFVDGDLAYKKEFKLWAG